MARKDTKAVKGQRLLLKSLIKSYDQAKTKEEKDRIFKKLMQKDLGLDFDAGEFEKLLMRHLSPDKKYYFEVKKKDN